MIKRALFDVISPYFHSGKVLVLTGPRQVGKTTLLRQFGEARRDDNPLFLDCDEPDIVPLLENATSTALRQLVGGHRLVFMDEAQRVQNIGRTLKLIADNIPGVQVVVSGSSALGLRDEVNEPLTGRKLEFRMFPFATAELAASTSSLEEGRLLEQRLLYGAYPDVVNQPANARRILLELANSYLYKDILAYKDIRRPELLGKLVTALALQLGSEVSYNELAGIIGADKETVERYLDLLEKTFVVFRLRSFSRNLRTELKKSQKVYFLDNGVRNAVLNNFQPLALRTDTGALWENFVISERRKRNVHRQEFPNTYFWRTQTQQEIDYIEERDGILRAFEIKWSSKKKARLPASFAAAYPSHEFARVTSAEWFSFVS
ncbi:MAG: ATP-binding protein [Puniceicoccales bacterium]|jgi:predicted AAA+ superfamily ATPase|nr:ATP-binding protein [Puniceicoccales bacterium]